MIYRLLKTQIERNNRKADYAANESVLQRAAVMLSIGQLTEEQYFELYELAETK